MYNEERKTAILKITKGKKYNEIRRLLAVWSAHCIKFACQLTGKQGATLAGKAALTIYPPILGELAKEVKEDILWYAEPMEKPTTNNLLASVLEGNHKNVVCNRTGSNMLNGVASAFVLTPDSPVISRLIMPVLKWMKPPR